MFKIPKVECTAEFKELTARRVMDGQRVGVVAKELGLNEQTLRNWVKAAKAGKLNPAGAKKVTPEQTELSRMRAENARLRMDNEILKKRRHISRKMCCEICLDRRARKDVPAAGDVWNLVGQHQWLPSAEARRQPAE